MNKLPIELHFEIEKFIKNKNEVFMMHHLSFNNAFKFNRCAFKKSYISTSFKLLKWYVDNIFLIK
jgi:hypothetical protein